MGLLDTPLITEMVINENNNRLEAKASRFLKKTKVRRSKRKKHKRKIPYMTYKQYMASTFWKKRKLRYWSMNSKSCAICQSKNAVSLHHKRYDVKYGEEPDSALVALCRFHHIEFHQNYPLRKDMVMDTDRYIDEARITRKQLAETGIDDLSWI